MYAVKIGLNYNLFLHEIVFFFSFISLDRYYMEQRSNAVTLIKINCLI